MTYRTALEAYDAYAEMFSDAGDQISNYADEVVCRRVLATLPEGDWSVYDSERDPCDTEVIETDPDWVRSAEDHKWDAENGYGGLRVDRAGRYAYLYLGGCSGASADGPTFVRSDEFVKETDEPGTGLGMKIA